jgi:DNA-binding transcriptional MerR regulator
MKMAELSQRSGTSVATIKYYIREGLLPAGHRTATNQARYDQEHLTRVTLIRALRDIAGLPVATIKQVFDAIEHPPEGGDRPDPLTLAFGALSKPLAVPAGEEHDYRRVADRIDGVVAELGWDVGHDAAARADLIRAVVAIDRHFPGGVSHDALLGYAQAAEHLAEREIPGTWDPANAPTDALRYAVLGTVLFEPVILALRRLAHVDRHRRLSRAGRASR